MRCVPRDRVFELALFPRCQRWSRLCKRRQTQASRVQQCCIDSETPPATAKQFALSVVDDNRCSGLSKRLCETCADAAEVTDAAVGCPVSVGAIRKDVHGLERTSVVSLCVCTRLRAHGSGTQC